MTRERVWETTQQYLDGAHATEPSSDADPLPPPDDDPIEDDGVLESAQMDPVDLDEVDVSPPGPDRNGHHPAPQSPPTSTALPVSTEESPTATPPPPDRYKKPLAVAAVIATGIATVLGSCGLWALRTGPHVASDQTGQDPTAVKVVAAPSPTRAAADPNQDAPVPYRATAHGCLLGSTAGQSVAGDNHSQAWVCVLGGNHGQYLDLDLGKTMHVSAVAITAGWPGKDASGVDQWHQHLMPTRVQWSCNDVPPTVVTQEDIHPGETIKSFDHGALCSELTMLVQETSRVPVDVPVSSTSAAPDGPLDEILGPPPTGPTPPVLGLPGDKPSADPADNTFAVLSVKVLAHPPN